MHQTRNRLLRGTILAIVAVISMTGCRELQYPWQSLAQCEASGDWAANTGNGFEGGLQFAPSTWQAYRDPDMPEHAYDASPDDQVIVAERVQRAQGWQAWPSCSRQLRLR